jgi:hypothetical protein
MIYLDETRPLVNEHRSIAAVGNYRIKPTKLLTTERSYVSTWDCVRETYREDGCRGIYRGMGVTMVRAFIGRSLAYASHLMQSMPSHSTAMNGSKAI